MKTRVENFPQITCILRGYTAREMRLILAVLKDSGIRSVEITMNTEGALSMIEEAVERCGDVISVGAGTVITMEQLKQVTEAGADFALSPVMFTREMLDYCRERGVISVPGAFTPSEIYTQLTWGADIVKVFPAVTVGPSYFRQLAGPLGFLPFMAVGGVNAENAAEFLQNGCRYLGIGSGMFDRAAVARGDVDQLRADVAAFERVVGLPSREGRG